MEKINLFTCMKLTNSNGQKQPPEMFCNKGVLRNFAKFT